MLTPCRSVFNRALRRFTTAATLTKTPASSSVKERIKETLKSSDGPEPSYSRPTGYSLFNSPVPFHTKWGVLPSIQIAYESWGQLNELKSNAILLQTGLSASSHAKSHQGNPERGWWEDFIGPGKALDTDKYFIICCNNLGGCFGSSGPSSINTSTGSQFGLKFPFVTVQDIVKSQFLVLDNLGIELLHAVVGSSLGGMQSLASAAEYPERVARMVTISAAALSHPMSIANRYTQRRALMSDPNFANGEYYGKAFPTAGMRLAREIATITYRSGPEWEDRFGRRRPSSEGTSNGQTPSVVAEFEVEKYLEHQGAKWCDVYDPNSMVILSKAMDLFTMESPDANGTPSLQAGLSRVKMPSLVMGSKSDVLFPIWQQKQIAEVLRSIGNQYVVYYELDTLYGHDTFLIDVNAVGAAVKGHLEQTV